MNLDAHTAQAGRFATGASQAATGAAGLPAAPGWAGYWTWVTAVMLLMFVFYLAQKGHLQTWLGFFTWTTPTAPQATNAQATNIPALGGVLSTINNGINAAGNGLGGLITTLTGVPPLTINTTK